jgi:predicted helicase
MMMQNEVQLRGYQKRAIKTVADVLSGRRRNKRGILHMACGTGKTLVGLRIWEKLEPGTTLLLVPTLNLVRQTLFEWTRLTTKPFEQLTVCSDVTVVDGLHENAEELGLEPTGNPDEVRDFLRAGDAAKVIFCTYQSVPVVMAALEGSEPLDLVIFDEAHRTASGGEKGKGLFKLALDDEAVPARRRVFMTATPRVFSKRAQSRAMRVGYDVSSMDDTKRYGPVLFRFSFAEAIQEGVLSDYQVLVMGVRDDEIERAVRGREFVNQDGEAVDAETVAKHVAIAKAIKRYGLRKILVFHRLVEDARRFSDPYDRNSFAATMTATGLLDPSKIWMDYVSGTMSVRNRTQKLDALRENKEVSILSNAKCLTEGIDVPALDAVVFMHPKTSTVDVAQAVGRTLRLPPGWSLAQIPKGHVVIPLVVRPGDDVDAVLDNSAFDTTAAVLRQMRSHDEALGDVIDTIRVNMGERKPSGIYGAKFTIPKVAIEDIPGHLNAENVRRAVTARLVELSFDTWEVRFKELVEFKKEHNHCNPGGKLGQWVKRQRERGRHGQLDGERRRKLTALGFTWTYADPELSLGRIHDEATDFFGRFGRWPGAHTREVEDGSALNNKWYRYDRWLRAEHGLSLAQFLEQRGVKESPTITNWILSMCSDYYDAHGKIPTPKDLQNGSDLASYIRRHKKMELSEFLRLHGMR